MGTTQTTPEKLPCWTYDEIKAHCGDRMLRERLDTGHGKRCWVQVHQTDVEDIYVWKLMRSDLELIGLGTSVEDAFQFADQVYREYMLKDLKGEGE